jgi:Tol biopolymer transport system component
MMVRRGELLMSFLVLILAAGGTPHVAATTPDSNGRIAFQMDFGHGIEIYTIRPNGLGIRQLTDVHGSAETPDWSPDGARIAFAIEDQHDQGVWIMKADGSHLHQVAASGAQPAFTPDGRHLVYDCGDCSSGGQGIFLVRADGSDAPGTRLTTNPSGYEGDTNPEVSPDGQTVTFVRRKAEGELQALFAVDIGGTHVRRLVPYRFNVFIKHDWAPDGQHIVFSSPIDGQANVYTIAPDGSERTQLTHVHRDQAAVAGSYSPDGRWIAFRLENQSIGVYRLMKMHPNGSDRSTITTAPTGERLIDWGPRAS